MPLVEQRQGLRGVEQDRCTHLEALALELDGRTTGGSSIPQPVNLLAVGQWHDEAAVHRDGHEDWDEPDDDRKQRLTGAFNAGYEAYARLYRVCTVSAEQAMSRLLVEAEKTARDIHSRYAE